MSSLTGKRIVLGVTGSIAAYKAADLASRLTQEGALVDAILTAAATRFVSALTFQSVTGRKALTDLWSEEAHVAHVGLGREAGVFLVAPATADILAKLAHGLADDLLTVAALASRAPLVLCPAMDGGMWEHPATQANVETLRSRGAHVIGPDFGRMASGLSGPGRLVEPAEIVERLRTLLGKSGTLAGRTVVVSAGPTHEPIDPVRFVGNRSSGRQGFAIARAALDRGARVVLVAGPTSLPTPAGAERIDVMTADEMRKAVLKASEKADALFMAAAVADFTPKESADAKLKKGSGARGLKLRLLPTTDILAEVGARRRKTKRPRVLVGFAAETGDPAPEARRKLVAKGLDLVVANDVTEPGAGFSFGTNKVVLISEDGEERLPLLSKEDVAEAVLDRVAARLPALSGSSRR